MHNNEIHVGLDIGTSMIKVIVAETQNGQTNVIGIGSVKSKGVKRGVIVDINETANAIKEAVDQAAMKANIQITEVVVGLPANQLKIEQVHGLSAITSQDKRISNDDVKEVARQALIQNLPPEREIIDLSPTEFIVDGFDGIKDPVDMVGVRLEMRGIAFTGPKTIIHNVKMAVEKAGFNLREFVIIPLAIGRAILSDGEQNFGTVLIDVGAGQTTVAVIHDYQLKFATVDQEGGNYITKDVSTVLNTSYSSAEKIKRDYGYADSLLASENNEIQISVVGKEQPVKITEKYLSEIIEARVDQIFARIFKMLQPIGALDMPGGIVLTGGSANLAEISKFVQQMFGMNVKIGMPNQIGLKNPAVTAGYAIVKFAAEQTMTERVVKEVVFGTQIQQTQQDNIYSENKKRGLGRRTYDKFDETDTEEIIDNSFEEDEGIFKNDPKKKITDRVKQIFNSFFD
ncbi:cell division protein FtsA [Periweissella beninensis]|uniref:cell division protein FtsA n=1 Tax=Periweissella beninensis TaxID=504936 RepID=UPI0021A31C6E|nr:cell division protein FtsA [Periweissella beninensis]MCT4396622.1 cell division protein FtsA [Periweissella beninensis]